jgi:hypothetical protein
MTRRNAVTKKAAGNEPRAGCRDLSVNQIGGHPHREAAIDGKNEATQL